MKSFNTSALSGPAGARAKWSSAQSDTRSFTAPWSRGKGGTARQTIVLHDLSYGSAVQVFNGKPKTVAPEPEGRLNRDL